MVLSQPLHRGKARQARGELLPTAASRIVCPGEAPKGSPDCPQMLVVTRFIGSSDLRGAVDCVNAGGRMNAVTTNGVD